MARELAVLVSGASGTVLAVRFVAAALESGEVGILHLVVSSAAAKVLAYEQGPEWASARGMRDHLPVSEEQRERVRPWADSELTASIASGSHQLDGVVVVPCSSGMAGSLANGISRGLAQRVGDVALKQRWPLLLAIRESPMSPILLKNLLELARAGAHIVPPLPAFYLKPDETSAYPVFVDHFCMRLLDLLGIESRAEGLRWRA